MHVRDPAGDQKKAPQESGGSCFMKLSMPSVNQGILSL